MSRKGLVRLKTNEEFKNLIPPLSKKEYLQLEENIISEGCREAIVVWNRTIIDGHNRYEICTRHKIPFRTRHIKFDCHEDAVAWICKNQLGRRNITEETRKFLIGMQYEAEKLSINKRNANGNNQYSHIEDKRFSPYSSTAHRIAEENGISHSTVDKYGTYARALEKIGEKDPPLVPKILSGKIKVSHNNVMKLSEMSPDEVKTIARELDRKEQKVARLKTTGTIIRDKENKVFVSPHYDSTTVKDMPKYDPDGEVTSLTLTIPSWESSMARVKKHISTHQISDEAKEKLGDQLLHLATTCELMLDALGGKYNE